MLSGVLYIPFASFLIVPPGLWQAQFLLFFCEFHFYLIYDNPWYICKSILNSPIPRPILDGFYSNLILCWAQIRKWSLWKCPDNFLVADAVRVWHIIAQADVTPLHHAVKLGELAHDFRVKVKYAPVVLAKLLDYLRRMTTCFLRWCRRFLWCQDPPEGVPGEAPLLTNRGSLLVLWVSL